MSDASSILKDILDIATVVAAGIGTWAGIQAFLVARETHDATILREELAPHRGIIAAAVLEIETHTQTLESSAHPLLPFDRVEANFSTIYPEVTAAGQRILDEVRKVDNLRLFSRAWEFQISPSFAAIERAWDDLNDEQQPEGDRRIAAMQIVAAARKFAREASELVRAAISAQLTTGVLGQKRRFRIRPKRKT